MLCVRATLSRPLRPPQGVVVPAVAVAMAMAMAGWAGRILWYVYFYFIFFPGGAAALRGMEKATVSSPIFVPKGKGSCEVQHRYFRLERFDPRKFGRVGWRSVT